MVTLSDDFKCNNYALIIVSSCFLYKSFIVVCFSLLFNLIMIVCFIWTFLCNPIFRVKYNVYSITNFLIIRNLKYTVYCITTVYLFYTTTKSSLKDFYVHTLWIKTSCLVTEIIISTILFLCTSCYVGILNRVELVSS